MCLGDRGWEMTLKLSLTGGSRQAQKQPPQGHGNQERIAASAQNLCPLVAYRRSPAGSPAPSLPICFERWQPKPRAGLQTTLYRGFRQPESMERQ
jgi:hypothetical protein